MMLLSPFVTKIVSGGQSGADRAALDWAMAHQIPHGGWCPRGRRAEDGVIPLAYRLQETDTHKYQERTLRNVRDSDGTLILNLGELDGGSLLTLQEARNLGRPYWLLSLDISPQAAEVAAVLDWLERESVAVLNLAGPRETKRPGIYQRTDQFLNTLAEMYTKRFGRAEGPIQLPRQ